MKLDIYGGNLAALALASKSLTLEVEITMQVSGPLKSHFSGLEFMGVNVDRGMVLLEPPPDGVNPLDISLYEGEYRADARPFLHNVFGWMTERHLDFHAVHVKTLFRSRVYNDIFISDCLELLQDLSRSEGQTATKEVHQNQLALGNSGIHPKHKNSAPWFAENSFLTSSRMTSGETVTRLIFEPFLFKIHGAKMNSLIANEHRSSWMPIYFPETVLATLSGSVPDLIATKFLYPTNQSIADFVDVMIREVNENCLIQQNGSQKLTENSVLQNQLSAIIVTYFGGLPKSVRTRHTDFALSQGRIVYLPCGHSTDQTFFVVDSEWSAFRLNVRCQSPHLNSYVCVEFGYSSSDMSDQDLIRESKSLCEFLGVPVDVGECTVISVRYPLRHADLSGLKKSLVEYRQMMSSRQIVGFPITDLNNSFNDQLCAGLKVFDQLSSIF